MLIGVTATTGNMFLVDVSKILGVVVSKKGPVVNVYFGEGPERCAVLAGDNAEFFLAKYSAYHYGARKCMPYIDDFLASMRDSDGQ